MKDSSPAKISLAMIEPRERGDGARYSLCLLSRLAPRLGRAVLFTSSSTPFRGEELSFHGNQVLSEELKLELCQRVVDRPTRPAPVAPQDPGKKLRIALFRISRRDEVGPQKIIGLLVITIGGRSVG